MEATRKSNHSETMVGLGPVVDRVAASAHQAVDKAAGAANAAARAVDKKSGKLLKTMQERYIDGCRDAVRDKPLATIGIAVAAGFVLSLLLIRR